MDAIYLGNNRILVKLKLGYSFIVPSDDIVGSSSLISDGLYEMALTNYMIQNIKPGMVCFDVGANIGYFSLLLSTLVQESGTVYSFEASPKMIPFIQENIRMNWLGHRCKILQKAVYQENGKLTFKLCNTISGNSSFFDRQDWYEEVYGDTISSIEVEAITLDRFAENLERIDFIKLDIEGAEYGAFLGMQKLLEKKKIGQIVFEWTRDMLRENGAPFSDLLSKINADFYLIESNGSLTPFNPKNLVNIGFIPNVLMKLKR